MKIQKAIGFGERKSASDLKCFIGVYRVSDRSGKPEARLPAGGRTCNGWHDPCAVSFAVSAHA
ncbi:MAG TPA: hypothetical protein VGD65_14160 [Chryseosolibacter sp.]